MIAGYVIPQEISCTESLYQQILINFLLTFTTFVNPFRINIENKIHIGFRENKQKPVARSFDVFFDLCLNKLFEKQPRRRRFMAHTMTLL